MSFIDKIGELYKNKDHIKYVDDYETELVQDEKGKYKKKTTYVGPYIPILENKTSLRVKLIITDVLSLMISALVVYAVLLVHTTGGWLLTMLPLGITLFPCLYLLSGCVKLPMSGKDMQRDHYMHSIIRCFRSSGGIIMLMAWLIVSELIYRIAKADWMFLKADIIYLACIFACIAFSTAIILILRSVDVDEMDLNLKG